NRGPTTAIRLLHCIILVERLSSGNQESMRNIGQERIRAIALPLPPPDDQRRIVAEIEKQFTRLEAGVAALRRVQANLKRYRAAVLKAACEGRLGPTEAELARAEGRPFESGQQLLVRILTERRQNWQGRGNYKEPDAPDTAKLGPLPDGWEWATVSQLSTRVVDGTHHTPEYMPDGVPFISVKDIRGGVIHFEDCKFISAEAHAELSKRCDVQSGDVLITKSGTIGRMAVVNTDMPFSLFVRVALIKPVRGFFDPKFLKVSLEGYIGSINISQDVKGALLKNLHLEDLRMVALRLPPLAEQTRIVAEVERRLSVVEELEAVVTTNLQRATRLRQSILQKAFTGEL
ncbi:MAG: restriction endonuclease subunit S, partial [Verrucomicrobiaceae bacterium]